MAFQVVLYKYTGEANVLNKNFTTIMDTGYIYNGTLKEGSSILTPTVRIQDSTHEGVVPDPSAPYRIVSRNYAYIAEFKRYYFITDIRSVTTNLWEIDMRVDVLRTYKDIIYQMPAFISRCEVKYNQFIRDPLLPLDYERVTVTEERTYGKIFQNNPYNSGSDKDKVPVLIVNVLTGAYNTYLIKIDGKQEYGNNVTIPSSFFSSVGQTVQTVFLCGHDLIRDFAKWLQDEDGGSRAASYITSMFLAPCIDVIEDKLHDAYGIICEPGAGGPQTFLEIGDLKFTVEVPLPSAYNGASYIASQGCYMWWDDNIPIKIEYPRDFTSHEPYTIRELYVPFYGWYRLNSKMMIQNDKLCTKIILHNVVDYTTGIDSVDIVYQYDDDSYKLGDKISMPFLLGIPIGATTADAVNRQHTNNVLSLVGGVISSLFQTTRGGMQTAAGVMTGNVGAIAGGMSQAASGIGSALTAGLDYAGKEEMNVEYGKISPAGSTFALLSSPNQYIYRVTKQVQAISALDIDKFRHLYGAPVSAPVDHLIDAVYEEGSYLKGWKYVKCGAVHVEDKHGGTAFYATDEEKSEIETLLMNGVQI